MPASSNWRPRIRAILLAASALAATGCGQPQVDPEHRDLVLRLATATSTQDRGTLDRAAAEIRRLETQGALGDDQRAAFVAILEHARDGDWERAQRLAYNLRDAQRPTTEDKQRVAKRILPTPRRIDGLPTGS